MTGRDIMRAALEAVGWTWDATDTRPVRTIADELLDGSMERGSEEWATAHAHCISAAEAAERGNLKAAIAALREVAL